MNKISTMDVKRIQNHVGSIRPDIYYKIGTFAYSTTARWTGEFIYHDKFGLAIEELDRPPFTILMEI